MRPTKHVVVDKSTGSHARDADRRSLTLEQDSTSNTPRSVASRANDGLAATSAPRPRPRAAWPGFRSDAVDDFHEDYVERLMATASDELHNYVLEQNDDRSEESGS